MGGWADVRLLVIAACGASAGVHAGLVGEHWRDSAVYGVLFALAALSLAGNATALTVWPGAQLPVFLSAGLFGSLIVAWIAAREPVDALAVVTKTIEATGLVLVLRLVRGPVTRPGDLTLAYFGLTFILAFVVASATGSGH